MNARGKLAVLTVVALTCLPTVLAAAPHEQSVVGSHSTYADMDGLDPCLASVVGIVRLRVMWFGGQVLFERSGGAGNYVYAVEHGAPPPVDEVLTPTGESFVFTDPNGLDWNVTEYNYTSAVIVTEPGGVSGTPPSVNTTGNVHVEGGNATFDPPGVQQAGAGPWTTWVVRTSSTQEDFAATGAPYNFVTMVDLCKFVGEGQSITHTNTGGTWSSSDADDTTFDQHLPGDVTHTHRDKQVDLYVAQQPRLQQTTDPDYLGEVAP